MWSQVGPPLRPCLEDVTFVETEVNRWADSNEAPRALILGVTPELYHLPWPEGTDVMAVDHTQEMINALWQGPKGAVLCAEWTSIPLPDASRDIVLCDGGLHLLSYPAGQTDLVEMMSQLVAPGGLFIVRLFAPFGPQETPDDVLEDLINGKIPNLNILKLRLGMSMQPNATNGVALAEVWEKLRSVAPDFDELATHIGWPIEHLLVINSYHESRNKYYFVTVDEVRRLFCDSPGGFELECIHTPDYELSDRCPTIVFRRLD